MENRLKERKGFALVTVILGLVVISTLGLSILGVTRSNFKMTKIDSTSQRAYYIAEAGINKAVDNIYKKVNDISEEKLNHDEFFDQVLDSIKTDINFEETFGEGVSVEIEVIKVEKDEEASSPKKEVRKYEISSKGQIVNSSRTVITSIYVSHEIRENIAVHPAFSNALYSGGVGTMPIASGTIVDGSIFADDIKFNASSTKVNGSIISRNSVELSDNMNVKGNIYAINGKVDIKSSSTQVEGDIHSNGKVTLNSGTSLDGGIFTNSGLILDSSNVVVKGDINAKGDISLGSGANVQNINTEGNVIFGSTNTVNGDINAGGYVGNGSGGNVKIHGNILSGSSVYMKDWQTFNFHGNVYANGDVHVGNNCNVYGKVISGGIVTNKGSITEGIEKRTPESPKKPLGPDFDRYKSIENPPLTEDLINYTPTNDVIDISGDTRRIKPGRYGNIKFDTNQDGAIVLESGGDNYFFKSITGQNQKKTIRYDFSNGGNINIYVKGNVKLNAEIEISEDGSTWTKLKNLDLNSQKKFAKLIYWESHGTFEINEGGEKQWIGTMFAKEKITVASKPYIVGSLVSNDVIKLNPYGGKIIYASKDTDAGTDSEDNGGASVHSYEGNIDNIPKIKETN